MHTLDNLAGLVLRFGHAANALCAEIGIASLDAAQAAQVLVPLLECYTAVSVSIMATLMFNQALAEQEILSYGSLKVLRHSQSYRQKRHQQGYGQTHLLPLGNEVGIGVFLVNTIII